MDKSSTAYCREDLVLREDLLWNRVKEKCHLYAQYQLDHQHKKAPTIGGFIKLVNNKSSLPVCVLRSILLRFR